MANHGYVTTRKHMTPAKVRALLDKLNNDYFFNVLVIEDCEYYDGTIGWSIDVVDTKDSRVCWLNSKRSFEIRHGGGSEFIWWIDSLISDAISYEFNGRVKDDAGCGFDEVLTTWHTPLTYPEYQLKSHSYHGRFTRMLLALLDYCPSKQYTKALKKKVKIVREDITT